MGPAALSAVLPSLVIPSPAADPVAFQAALARWYRAHARALPWRTQPSLYRTVVSEFMLQQTQVKTVLPYFARWCAALPDFAALAAAAPEAVLRLWEGLGYYSRARNLHRLAQELIQRQKPPQTPSEWQEFPGVGPYTAAAITSIAFGQPAACVDGNVVRILARLSADSTPFRDSAQAARHFEPLAQTLLPPEAPGDHNQAMMELGATVCLRSQPLCPVCPVRGFCAGAEKGNPGAYPKLAAKSFETRRVTRVWIERRGELLLHRAPAEARQLSFLHELPLAATAGLDEKKAGRGLLLAERKRGITRFRITEAIHSAAVPRGALRPDLVWIPLKDLEAIALSGPHRRWVGEILAARARS